MLVTTETGSIYELDTENRRVRRMMGSEEPTPREGIDGAWKPYVGVGAIDYDAAGLPHDEDGNIIFEPIRTGQSMVIVWRLDDGVIARTTITSHITSMLEK